MMRQTKAVLTTWIMACALCLSLVIFGCARNSTGDEHQENMNGEQMHENGETHHGETSGESGPGMANGSSNGHMSGTTGEMEPSGTISNGVRIVTIRARQFEFDPDTIVVNQGEKVRLSITSEDVTHGFGLADFDIERTLPPNETQIVEFTADQAGQHHFHCTEYCGEGHDDMHGELVVQVHPRGKSLSTSPSQTSPTAISQRGKRTWTGSQWHNREALCTPSRS